MAQRRPLSRLPWGAWIAVAAGACATPAVDVEDVRAALREAAAVRAQHRGPDVEILPTGPARFAGAVYESFQPSRAMDVVRFADRWYRAPANPGYDAVVDRIVADLRAASFGEDPRLLLEVLEREAGEPAWTPVRAKLVLHAPGREPRVLHAFDAEEGADRTMLPVHAPTAEVTGNVALELDEVREGSILVTGVPLLQVLERAESNGAVAVVSAALFPFNVDPTGAERHLDAIAYREVPPGTELAVAQISPRTLAEIQQAVAEVRGRVRLELVAETRSEERPLRTVVATIVGASRPEQAVAISSHVQEPGANDNASGVATLLEGARAVAGLLREGRLTWPDRSLVFLWGDEFRQTEDWLDATERQPVAGLSSDMTGAARGIGAIALLERHPDPGAVNVLPPDMHTPWGAQEVEPEMLVPNGLAVVARTAMADVARLAGGWETADHPWEGGSDHDVYVQRGVPACLFWHFTDFTYHTSLDRPVFVDPEEMRRTGTAILATALAVADPEPGDLERYVKSLEIERAVRTGAAREASLPGVAEAWEEWCHGARMWLRELCLGPEAEPVPRDAGAGDGGDEGG